MNINSFLPKVKTYLDEIDLSVLSGWERDLPWQVDPLAQGEYNMNFLLRQDEARWVLRINIDTQIALENQIRYEFETLAMLANSGFTPRPFYVDDTKTLINYGVLIMEYLEGDALVYKRDIQEAARLFAGIHRCSHQMDDGKHLLVEKNPLSMTYAECSQLLQRYFGSPAAKPTIQDYLKSILEWADEARTRERYFQDNPWWCVINTEVNSSNFIVNQKEGCVHLVDWEKPLWGDPSQDLSHFSVPTTTLWKTNHRLTEAERQLFLDTYRMAIADEYLAETIEDRVNLRDPFNCLRGVSWCAMAWVSYRCGTHILQNADTFVKLEMYLDSDFLHSVFDPYLERA